VHRSKKNKGIRSEAGRNGLLKAQKLYQASSSSLHLQANARTQRVLTLLYIYLFSCWAIFPVQQLLLYSSSQHPSVDTVPASTSIQRSSSQYFGPTQLQPALRSDAAPASTVWRSYSQHFGPTQLQSAPGPWSFSRHLRSCYLSSHSLALSCPSSGSPDVCLHPHSS